MKEELAADLRERRIAELVEHDKVHAGEIFGKPAPAGAMGFAFKPIDAKCARSGNRIGSMQSTKRGWNMASMALIIEGRVNGPISAIFGR